MRIGRYKFGFAQLSMGVVFIVLSLYAVVSAIFQARPEYPMPVSVLIMINESVALLATLVYGILVHIMMTLISWIKSRKD